MFSKEVDLKIKFEYEGQKRVILLPQPVKYHQLIDKLHQLCGSQFTVEYSAAEGEFIREIECQEDLDDVIGLTKNNERIINCLLLKLIPCASSSQQSTTGDSKPAVTWSSSVITRTPKQSGGFFQDELSDPCPTSSYKPCVYSPSLGVDSPLLRCKTITNYSGKPEKRVDYIPEFNQDHNNQHPSIFIPEPMDFNASSNYNAKKKASERQVTQQSLESSFSASPGFGTRHVRSKSDSQGIGGSFTPGKWVKGKLLGRGAFGQVFTGYDIDRGIEFAVKQVQIYSQSNEVLEQIKALEMEISVLQGIHHDHVVEYYGMQSEPDCLSIFIEFIPMGSVRDHINRYGMLTEKVTGRYTSQVLKGLAYLHSKMIVHRDIKCANILRDHRGNLKLGDFGAAKLLQSQSIAEMSKIAGTPYFMAPEVIRGEACGCRSDIWSLGCTVIEMLTKNPPWYKYDSIAAIYRIGNVWPPEYELPDGASDSVQDFLCLCFAACASNRPRAEELLIHAFIHQNNMLS